MNTDYRYQLETPKLTGHRQQKTTCPACGRRKCFVRYVDAKEGFCYVADEVGKCDHLHSCGYHYKPSDYYRDNPRYVATESQHTAAAAPSAPVSLPPFQPLPEEYVVRSHSPRSTFWQWFSTRLAQQLAIPQEQVQRVYEDYLIGATRWGSVIFWQVDGQGLVHGGHIMQYRPDGHRDGYQGWTHALLIEKRLLPLDWQLYQCFFGEHLLPHRPDARVCLVESEKTALVMAALCPQHLWIASSGCGGLNPEKLAALQGRRLTVFPDSGCYDKWLRQLRQTPGLDYNISASLEQFPPNTDLCDLLLEPPP